MRLAIVVSTLAGGGAERVLTEMANYWARRQWEITIVSWSTGPHEEAYPLDATVGRIPLNMLRSSHSWRLRLLNNFRRILLLRKTLRQLSPDAVISFMDSTNVVVLMATRGLRIPIVVSERSDPSANTNLSGIWRLLRRWTYSWSDAVVAQTMGAGEWLDRNCGVRSIVIPNMLRSLPAIDTGAVRQTIILAVGRLVPEKDWGTLFRAYALVHMRNPHWRLILVGEGPERAALSKLASDLGIAEYTSFEGFVARPETYMAQASISVLCSKFEGFPNALLESMAMGNAVVASDCGSGTRALIDDGINGRLFETGDASGLAVILEQLMTDSALLSRLAARAVEVRGKFALANVMAQWECALGNVVGGTS